MSDRHSLIAFCATLLTIFALAICAAVAANHGKDTSAYLGAITGLIGVIGTFRPRGATSPVQDETLKAAVEKIPPVTGEVA